MASIDSSLNTYMRQPLAMLQSLYKAHSGKDAGDMAKLQIAQYLHKSGVTINRRSGGNSNTGTGVNFGTRAKPKNAVRAAIRDLADNVQNEGTASKTLHGNGQTFIVNATLNKDGDGIYSITVDGQQVAQGLTDYAEVYHEIFRLANL